MLQLDLDGIREVLDGAEREESESDELVHIPPQIQKSYRLWMRVLLLV